MDSLVLFSWMYVLGCVEDGHLFCSLSTVDARTLDLTTAGTVCSLFVHLRSFLKDHQQKVDISENY